MHSRLFHRFCAPLLSSALLLVSLNLQANTAELYQVSGMHQHQEHFQQALQKAQQRYANQLPANVYQTLVRQSNQRFEPNAMHDRAQGRLAVSLDPNTHQQALGFYQSPLGRKVVQLETIATAPANVAAMQAGLPPQTLSPERQALLGRLGNSLPALDLGVEVSMALANLATQSANDFLGGLMQIPDGLINNRREGLRSQMQPNLGETLAYVYRDLSDAELGQYATWSESNAGRQFYRAVEVAVRDALNP